VPHPVLELESSPEARLATGYPELDRVLGGGVVPGSVTLLSGDPGIGKSTLMLQVAHRLTGYGPVLYVSGEESNRQIRMRAERLGALGERLFVQATTRVEQIIKAATELSPAAIFVDSIQTLGSGELDSAPGSVGQVRHCTELLVRYAKLHEVPIFLVGHVTKDSSIAGPRTLEHTVDVVLFFEGERHYNYRMVRGIKNRFGSTMELGVFQMADRGLEEVPNPSFFFLEERALSVPGSVIVPSLEGTRPVLVEIQALVAPARYGSPRRTTAGFDQNRVALLMAVLERRAGVNVGDHDAYIKVTGGLRLDEPAVDLACAVAIYSSFVNRPVTDQLVVIGEIGLGGELRGVHRASHRLTEAEKLGFTSAILPRANLREARERLSGKMQLIPARTLKQALDLACPKE